MAKLGDYKTLRFKGMVPAGKGVLILMNLKRQNRVSKKPKQQIWTI